MLHASRSVPMVGGRKRSGNELWPYLVEYGCGGKRRLLIIHVNIGAHCSQDYRGYVLLAHDTDENYYVAKSIKKGSREINALQKMLSLPSPRNRVVPGHLFECQDSYVYLMPRLERVGMGSWASETSWRAMLDQLYTIIDVRFIPCSCCSFDNSFGLYY